mgnify:CR=1 FL=1
MKVLLFSGSLRADSLNKKLINSASAIISKELGCAPEIVDIKSLSIPVYDGDIEQQSGLPQGVVSLGQSIKNANALIISSPEYNGSIAGSLKNAIDWISRIKPVPFDGKPLLLMGASPGYFGAIRALGFTKPPFEALGSFVYPQTFALPKASEMFSATGELTDASTHAKLQTLLTNYIQFSKKLNVKS